MTQDTTTRVSTGIEGLDEITQGGFLPERSYLVDGPPGAGKSLLGLQYLVSGTEAGESALYVNLEESVEAIERNAESVGLDTDDIEFLDLSPGSDVFAESQSYDIFDASEVEQEPLVESITDRVEAVEPDRVFVDPITQFQHISADEYQFRKQVLGFKRYLDEHGATLLFTAQDTEATPSEDIEFLADGTIKLGFAETGRRISVPKFRGSATQEGEHVMKITDDGIDVFPELKPDEHHREFESGQLSAGVPGIDELLHGGIEHGTVTILSGPTGVGKTTLGTQFIKEGAGRGDRSVLYLFEESKHTFLERTESVNIPVHRMEDQDTLEIIEVEPSDISPQEFAANVREQVEEKGTDIVMIDGMAGYRISLLGQEETLVKRIHALGRYLKNMGVTTILIEEIDSVTGEFEATSKNTSYLADNLLFLQHIELDGELRKTIGMLKKRTSDYGRSLREFQITEHGIKVGEPMTGIRGILKGTPERIDEDEDE
jgi:circadian clock protein KaiC